MIKLVLSFNLLTLLYAYWAIPSVNVNLDDPPRVRWQPAAKKIIETYGYDRSFAPVFAFHNQTTFAKLTPNAYLRMANAIDKNFPEYAEEIRGILDVINRADVTFEYMAAWAYFHELGHTFESPVTECTGVLVSVNGQVIHGRNMDQSPDEARNLVLHLHVYKNGKKVGESVDWYWFKVGFVTLLKYNVASLEENWRFGNYLPLESLLTLIEDGVSSLAWAYREVLEDTNIDTFEKVVSYLEKNRVGCALYNIIAGSKKNEGVIISRDPLTTFKTLRLGVDSEGVADYQFLVQTNFDHWEPDPEEDGRRTVAENLLRNMGKEFWNELGVFAVMDTYPIHNEGTFYTTITVPNQNRLIGFGQPGIEFSE